MVPATIAASCAFMLPSGTGPNASVLASGQLSIPQMARAGLGLNIIAIIFIFFSILFYIVSVSGYKVNNWDNYGIIMAFLKRQSAFSHNSKKKAYKI